jgi:broad-specificity NMP kinase
MKICEACLRRGFGRQVSSIRENLRENYCEKKIRENLRDSFLEIVLGESFGGKFL